MKKNIGAAQGADENRIETGSERRERKHVWKKSRLQRAILRCIIAAYVTIVLVLVGIIPEGSVPTASAAGPSKGSVTVYKYKKVMGVADLLKKDDIYHEYLLTYIFDGDYYAPYTNASGRDNWPATKASSLFTHFDAQADEFYSRNYVRHRIKSPSYTFSHGPAGNDKSYGVFIFTNYNGIGQSNSLTGIKYNSPDSNEIIPYKDYTFGIIPMDLRGSEMRFQQWYGWGTENNYKSRAGLYLYGDGYRIQGSGDIYSTFYLFEVQSNAYTCINQNYTIGTEKDPQVYVADADLFLKEGVTLTVPAGSVLCVKKGDFFVNGEIRCAGTILVEDGGVIRPFESTGSGSRIILEEGGTMIIRKGGKVFAGCPKGCVGTPEGNGWLDMYAGSSIINYGVLLAGQCNFSYGQATLENHKGGIMALGYALFDGYNERRFINFSQNHETLMDALTRNPSGYIVNVGASQMNTKVYLGKGANTTILKTWDGAITTIANKVTDGDKYGTSVKTYSYDANGKLTIGTYEP